jgi:hypothetical protein
MTINIGDPTSMSLNIATWVAAVAALATFAVLALTLKVAWANLTEFKSSERVKRTAELFFDFYTKEYMEENAVLSAPPFRQTPSMAIASLIRAPKLVKPEIAVMAHNYLEAVAALHWKHLIDSDLYFDSFAVVIAEVYGPLSETLSARGNPLTPYSRIPALYSDANRYLEARASNPK